ncbi:hypothetical protein DH2020_027879 [Rehmannia glutinosa]|uniref:Translocation protein SEC62 n=1 Tax=Rehmannia glutinosa TaxID=99300 RepID=A0ABR0VVU8_REHGL
MKKPGSGGGGGASGDKKRGRRSYGDSATDTPPRKQAAKKDIFQIFAEKVRDHKDLESRWAILQETRVEYFRGKDFVSFLRNHPELKDVLESDKNLESEDIANILLRKNLIVRCDRVVKIVRPGKRKLSTWPAHLEIFPDQVFSDNDAFFAWTFVNRRPLWQTLLAFFWPVLTLAICLFPVYPHQEATLKELFQFLPKKDEDERPKWTARLFYAVVAVLVILLLRHHAPDEAARARYQRRVSNIIDDVLEWDPRLALSGIMEKQTVFNGTDSENNVTDGSEGSTEKISQPGDPEDGRELYETEDGPIFDQHEAEEIENVEETDH